MDKAYIVANKEQELDVLKKLENDGFKWGVIGTLPTKFRFSEAVMFNAFPYVISTHEDAKFIGWSYYSDYHEGNVVYDGRKEEKMYKVTREFMNELIKWRDDNFLDATTGSPFYYLSKDDLGNLNNDAKTWWYNTDNPIERNKRLIAIVSWLNGEDVFEVEKEPKFYVRVDVDGEEQSVAMWQNSDGESGIAFDVFMRNEPAYTETDADNLVAGLTALNARKVKVEE